MKKLHRKLALVLVMLLLVSTSASVAGATTDEREMVGNTYVTGLPIVEEPEVFRILIEKRGSDKSNNQNEKDIMRILNEETNIIIEWEEVSSDINEKLNLLLSAGANLPDAFMTDPSEMTILQHLGKIQPLNDMMEQWAPNITKQVTENTVGGLDELKKADGVIYTLPSGPYAEKANAASSITAVPQAWLEQSGMDMPTNTDEFYEMLKYFKEHDMNGNGDPNDEIPLAFCQRNWATRIMGYAGPWGIGGNVADDYHNYYYVKDGKFVSILDTVNFRDFLRYMHKLADEGLMNIEGFSMTNAQYSSLEQEQVIGVHLMWAWPTNLPIPVMTTPGYEGQEVKQGQAGLRTANMNGFFISKDCKNPEALLRWWDTWHRDANTKRTARDGKEGTLWIDNKDGTATVVEPKPEDVPANLTSAGEICFTDAFRTNGPVMFGDEVAAPDYDVVPITEDALRYQYYDMYVDYFRDEFLPVRAIPVEKNAELALIRTELEAYISEFIATSVVNGLSDEQWEKHIDYLDKLRVDEWIQWYQDFIDGKF